VFSNTFVKNVTTKEVKT